MPDIAIHADAEAEYEEPLARYRSQSEQAAAKFELALERALQSISMNPHSHPKLDDHHRFCSLRRYPYLVIFRVDGEQIRVVAIAHSRRRPGYWSRRA